MWLIAKPELKLLIDTFFGHTLLFPYSPEMYPNISIVPTFLLICTEFVVYQILTFHNWWFKYHGGLLMIKGWQSLNKKLADYSQQFQMITNKALFPDSR